MSSFRLGQVADKFAVGATVSVYARNTLPGASQITGAAITTGTVASDGSVSFGGLAVGTNYVASDGTNYIGFQTGPNTRADNGALDSGQASMDRLKAGTNAMTLAAGVLRLAFWTADQDELVTTARVPGGSTAQVGSTLIRYGLWTVGADGGLSALVASTASDLALFGAGQPQNSKALQAAYLFRKGQRYAAGPLCVGNSTAPTITGQTVSAAGEAAVSPRKAASLSGQTDLPATVAVGSLVNSASMPYIAFS
jgi:hypothetical protein